MVYLDVLRQLPACAPVNNERFHPKAPRVHILIKWGLEFFFQMFFRLKLDHAVPLPRQFCLKFESVLFNSIVCMLCMGRIAFIVVLFNNNAQK